MKKLLLSLLLAVNLSYALPLNTKQIPEIQSIQTQISDLKSSSEMERDFNERKYTSLNDELNTLISLSGYLLATITFLATAAGFVMTQVINKKKQEIEIILDKVTKTKSEIDTDLSLIKKIQKEITEFIANNNTEIYNQVIKKDTDKICKSVSLDYKYIEIAFPYLELRKITTEEEWNNLLLGYQNIDKDNNELLRYTSPFYYLFIKYNLPLFLKNMMPYFKDYITTAEAQSTVYMVTNLIKTSPQLRTEITNAFIKDLGGKGSEKYNEYIKSLAAADGIFKYSYKSPSDLFNIILDFKDSNISTGHFI